MAIVGNRNAVRAELEWQGLDELQRYLERTLPNKIDSIIVDSLLKTAYDGKKRAKELVPVDTGALRDSIRVERLARQGRTFYIGFRAGGYRRNPRTGKLVDYASFVEFGTSRQRAQPFIRPAMRWAYNNKLQNHIWSAIAKEIPR